MQSQLEGAHSDVPSGGDTNHLLVHMYPQLCTPSLATWQLIKTVNYNIMNQDGTFLLRLTEQVGRQQNVLR